MSTSNDYYDQKVKDWSSTYAIKYNEEIDKENAINPSHYKDIVPGMQYMEMMVHMLPDVESHLLGQVYKYLMRCGKKDSEIQELEKANWYLTALIKYKQKGKVI